MSALAMVVLSACVTRRMPARVELPHSASMLMHASSNDRAYRIWVALPEHYNPRGAKYPVLYAVDANAEFFTVVEAARLAASDLEIPEIIVVGIGYDLPGPTVAELQGPRALDLTPTRDTAWMRKEIGVAKEARYAPPEGSGGAAEFLRFMREDLAPSIERRYHASAADRGYFGHSLGGLFGLYALMQGDGFFTRLLIGSPSLWWDNRVMFAAETTFAQTHRALPVHLFISAGALETKTVANVEALAGQLRSRNYAGLRLDVATFPGERHDPAIPATISRGIRVLYGK